MTLRITHFERPLVQAGHSLTAKGRIFSRGSEPFQDAWVDEAVRDYAGGGYPELLSHQRELAARRPVRVEAMQCRRNFVLMMVAPAFGYFARFACNVIDMEAVDEIVNGDRCFCCETASTQVAPVIRRDAPKEVIEMSLAVAFIGWAHRVLGVDLALTDVEVVVASDGDEGSPERTE